MNKRNGICIIFLMGIIILSFLLETSMSAGLGFQANFPILSISPLLDHSKNVKSTHQCNSCTKSSSGADFPQKHPIMSKDKWIQRDKAIMNLPKVGINPELRAFTYPSSLSLLQYIPSYNNRDQGQCGNCWVWGCTAPIEVAHFVQNGISDRLSIQYLDSNYNSGRGSNWACCGGNEIIFQNFYNSKRKFIPWSNTNAGFRDGTRSCSQGTSVLASSISTTPNYPITSIKWNEIKTVGIKTEQAISNIKSYLSANKAVTLGFYLPDFTPFWDFWDSNSGVWIPDQYCGLPDGQYPGGHEVTIVGYDDTDPSNRYWIALNSWGTSSAHPDGTFKLKMDMNYNCSNGGYYSYDFGYFDVTFSANSPPANPSKPTGSASGRSKMTYRYSTSTTDPDRDQVKYTFDWGDGTTSTTSFVNSGSTVSASHAWRNAGTYQVKAMATDSKGAPSGWSPALQVKMI